MVDSVLSSDIAGNGGFGLKFFLGQAFAFRIDVRDHVFRQQLLAQKMCQRHLDHDAGFQPLPADEGMTMPDRSLC